ncbi:hypothetical protein ONS96_008315 [Cadophora gregata f. sp. sojae]|nr:hypothetical protein ONS96_008315 [Cadophora gregata f. sp. sojae]
MHSDDSLEFVLVNDEDVNDYNETGIAPQPPDVLVKIQEWLQPTDYNSESSEYHKHLNSYLRGTGEWVQETEAYQQWHSSPEIGSLWLKGTAGAGKSVLAAMLADKLAKTEEVPVLFFFFRQIIATNHDPQSLVRDWISMILNHSPSLQATLLHLVDERRGLETISASEFWQYLVHALVSIPKVYCIIDALDEMDIDKQDFFTNIVNLGKRKPSSIKLLITSRPLPRIEAVLRTPSVLQIRLEQLKVDKDIAVYVDHRLQLASVEGDLRASVKEAVGGKAQGSFLYARLMMDELLDHLTQMVPDIKYIEPSLTWLPLTLEDMYNGMLIDHSLRSRVPQDLQLTILQWVTHSSRPLRLLELAFVIDLQSGSNTNSKDTKAIARAACGPLLEILEDETVSVIHHSFTEFLMDQDRRSRPASDGYHPQFPVIDSATAHKSMALICLKYLDSGCLNDWALMERKVDDDFYRPKKQVQQPIMMKHPFLDYAMNNFYLHVCRHGLDESLLSQLDAFMRPDNYAFSAWVDMTWDNTYQLEKISPLHVAAWAGMADYVEHLLNSGNESNSGDGRLRTPLSWASAKGHTEVVASLLEYVIEPDVDDDQGLKPLHYAAQGNHHKIVKLLLDSGVSPLTEKTKDYNRRCGNSPSSIGESPLMYACQSGSVESVRTMIPFLTPENLNQALCWAATPGKAQVLDLLLDVPGVQVDPPGQLDTPLFLAAKCLHFDAMRSLLSKGADSNKISENAHHMQGYTMHGILERGKTGPSPLHAVCGLHYQSYTHQNDEENMKKCFGLLLKYGCDMNPIDKEGKTPLHYSVKSKKHSCISLLLLKNGADPTRRDKSGHTPLHLLDLHEDCGPLIELMTAKGARMNDRASDGRTPLHCMVSSIHELEIEPLLPLVDDWNVADSNGDTPLHVLLSQSYHPEAGLQVLLKAGADLHRRNKKGELPIHVVKELIPGFGTSILPLLLAAGANLEAKDHSGGTVLSRLADTHTFNFQKTAQYLVEMGADVNCCDFEGNSILHRICRKSPDATSINFFVEAGVNPLSVNHAGNNLLHELFNSSVSADRIPDILANLLKLKVLPTAKNNSGQTPLHIVCSRASPSYESKVNTLDLVLRSPIGASIDAEDNNGIRPVHLAAATSEQHLWKLLNHGADIQAVTYEGLNLLHVSARTRQPNIVGLLIERLRESDGLSLLNAVDYSGRTTLHYACRSGRPETVSLLLNSGADVSIMDKELLTPLHACAEFEEEQVLWSTHPTGWTRACGILINDKSRPDPDGQNMSWNTGPSIWERVHPGNKTARIREIIRLSIKHGAEIAFCGQISSPIDLAVRRGCTDMVHELLPLMEPIYAKAKEETRQYGELGTRRNPKFQEKYLFALSNVTLREEDVQGCLPNMSLATNLLSLGHLDALKQLPSLGVDFSPNTDRNSDFLTTLVKCGYADLFQAIGDSVTTPGWINGVNSGEYGKSLDPYLITAVNSDLPNLDIIKIAVERFGADVNIQPETRVYHSGNTDDNVFGPTPLHILASASRWWQTDAMQYLLSKGANTELKNQLGQSVLNYAVCESRSSGSYRRTETVKILLEHGADPNSVDNDGMSSLNNSMHDLELVTLLIKHGADVTLGVKPVLFSAITSLDVAAVSVLLKAGADCNAKQRPVDKPKPVQYHGSRVPDAESTPLHFAASAIFNTLEDHLAANEIVKLLLENGADPYARIGEDRTLVHDIFKTGGIIQPFLEFQTLDLEHRDRNGQTVLLAASQSRWGTREPSQITSRLGDYRTHDARMAELRERYVGDLSGFLSVYQRGGKVEAVDNAGNSIFHFLVQLDPVNKYQNGFNALAEKCQTIIDQRNKKGHTPLHIALAKSNWWAVKRLMDAGADPLLKDPDGNTPLHHLASTKSIHAEDQLQWFSKLLDLGIAIDERNNLGETALFKYFTGLPVVTSESQEPFSSFLKAGANMFTMNNEGETLLHLMAKKVNHNKRFDIYVFGKRGPNADGFKFLMKMGLDPMTEDKDHRTPLDVAAACSNNLVLDLFKRDKPASPEVVVQQDKSFSFLTK